MQHHIETQIHIEDVSSNFILVEYNIFNSPRDHKQIAFSLWLVVRLNVEELQSCMA